MGIFSRNFNKPGPGVPKDMPRKKGAARFFELLLRDFGDLVKLNLIFAIVLIPTIAAFLFGAPSVLVFILGVPSDMQVGLELNIIFLLASLAFAFPVGGAMTAYTYYITKMMRDDPSYVWYEFKRKFKENYKQAAPMGIICTAFVYFQLIMWSQVFFELMAGVYTGGLMWVILAILSLLLFSMIVPYIFMHFAYIDLKTMPTLKNSILMSFAYLPRSFMGAFLGGIIWVLMMLFLPSSLILLPFVALIFVSFSMLLSLSWMWPKFDKHFSIEDTLVKRAQEEFKEEDPL